MPNSMPAIWNTKQAWPGTHSFSRSSQSKRIKQKSMQQIAISDSHCGNLEGSKRRLERLWREGVLCWVWGWVCTQGLAWGGLPKKCCWGWIGELSTGSSGALSTQWGWGSQWQGGQQAEGPSWGALGAWMGIVGFMLDAKELGRIVSRAVTKSLWLPRQSVLNRRVEDRRRGVLHALMSSRSGSQGEIPEGVGLWNNHDSVTDGSHPPGSLAV